MFTGIVTQLGVLRARENSGHAGRLTLALDAPLTAPQPGESIAVNGVCLTLERCENGTVLIFHTLSETLQRTNLGALPLGSTLNIERALLPTDRMGGHIVSGHVDATVPLLDMREENSDVVIKAGMLPQLEPYMVEKGSVCLEGVSLTLVEVTPAFFTVHLIPETLRRTALATRKIGTQLNVETDIVGKYIVKNLPPASGSVTMQKLRDAGF